MKHLLSITLSAIYLLASVGIVVNSHYCGGNLSSVEVFSVHADCCCGLSDAMAHCCNDELALYQLDEDQQASQQLTIDFTNMAVPEKPAAFEILNWDPPVVKDFRVEQFDLPPPPGPPIWLKNCSLTYYG